MSFDMGPFNTSVAPQSASIRYDAPLISESSTAPLLKQAKPTKSGIRSLLNRAFQGLNTARLNSLNVINKIVAKVSELSRLVCCRTDFSMRSQPNSVSRQRLSGLNDDPNHARRANDVINIGNQQSLEKLLTQVAAQYDNNDFDYANDNSSNSRESGPPLNFIGSGLQDSGSEIEEYSLPDGLADLEQSSLASRSDYRPRYKEPELPSSVPLDRLGSF